MTHTTVQIQHRSASEKINCVSQVFDPVVKTGILLDTYLSIYFVGGKTISGLMLVKKNKQNTFHASLGDTGHLRSYINKLITLLIKCTLHVCYCRQVFMISLLFFYFVLPKNGAVSTS